MPKLLKSEGCPERLLAIRAATMAKKPNLSIQPVDPAGIRAWPVWKLPAEKANA